MPRKAQTPEEKEAAKAAKQASGIEVERPKSVLARYRDSGGNVIAAVNTDANGEIQLYTNDWVSLSDVQLKSLRTYISKSLNSRKAEK